MFDICHCPCAGVHLDKLIQPTILLFLTQQKAHGYALVKKISQSPMFAGSNPDPAGVYRVLKSMESRGLVSSSWEIEGSGPPKRILAITGEGEECLQMWIETLKTYRSSIEALLAMAGGLDGELEAGLDNPAGQLNRQLK